MAFIIWLDDDEKEIKRQKKGRGRPPRGTERREDGNFYVSQIHEDRTIYYVVRNADGTVIKTPKGRGRPKPGFAKGAGGHWYEVGSPVEVK